MGFETKKQRAHELDMQNKQHQYDVDMFNRTSQFNADQAQISREWERNFYDYTFRKQSEYESPASQVSRMQAAGLNPALLAQSFSPGSADASAGSSGSASATGSNTVDAVGAFNASSNRTLGMLNSISSIAQQYANYRSTRELQMSQSVKNLADAAKTSGVDTDVAKETVKNLSASTANIKSDTKLKENQSEQVAADTKRLGYLIDKVFPKQLEEASARIRQIGNEIEQSQNLTRAQVAKFNQEVVESINRVHLNEKQQDFITKQLEWYDSEVASRISLNDEQFQQLKTTNMLLKTKNELANDILNGTFDGHYMDKASTEKIFRLRALMTLDGAPDLQTLPKMLGVDVAPTTNFGF